MCEFSQWERLIMFAIVNILFLAFKEWHCLFLSLIIPARLPEVQHSNNSANAECEHRDHVDCYVTKVMMRKPSNWHFTQIKLLLINTWDIN